MVDWKGSEILHFLVNKIQNLRILEFGEGGGTHQSGWVLFWKNQKSSESWFTALLKISLHPPAI